MPDAMYTAFADGEREIASPDLIGAARDVVPLSKTAAETFAQRRDWARGRMQRATSDETQTDPKTNVRNLDL